MSDPLQPAPADAAIGVVVVSYWNEHTLDDCLTRLRGSRDVAEIVVVDNGSGDASAARALSLASADGRIRVIANPDNPGFAHACNQGAALLQAPWLALVNPDCLVQADTLARLVRHAHADPALGLLGCEHVDAGGILDVAARRRDPTVARMLSGRGRRDSLTVERDPAAIVQPVDAASGALMLLPRALFARIGGFDTGYRLHAEDLDLCRRVRQAGFLVAVANDVRVLHLRGVSSRRRPVWVEWQKHRGLWRYFRKFESAQAPPGTQLLLWCAIWAHFVLAALRAAAHAR